MTTSLIGTSVTLYDLARRLDPDGKVMDIVEMLKDTNEILQDMRWVEGNLPTGHLTTIRTGLPSVAWRLLNYGVATGKSQTKQVTDSCGMLEAYAEIDKKLADINGNTAAFRLSEDRAFLEAMNQALATTLFYGDTSVNPERFVGLAPRFSSPSTDDTQAGYNMIDGGGAEGQTDCTSIWLVCWGDHTAHGIVPKGSKAGWQHQDLGEVTLDDANGNHYQGYRTHYTWDCGLTVRDWRGIVRICNIDTSLLNGSSAADLIDLMISASERITNAGMGNPVWYCNKTVRTALRKQIRVDSNVNLTWDTVEGKRVLAFDDIPIRRCDAITNSESAITGTFASD